jgi:hypothetical protein
MNLLRAPSASHKKDKNMKPTIQFIQKNGESSERSRSCSAFPLTDYSYHAASMAKTGSRCFGSCRPSLRAISQDYFETEEPRSFASEALLFTVMMTTAILPILNSASALMHLLRSLGTF